MKTETTEVILSIYGLTRKSLQFCSKAIAKTDCAQQQLMLKGKAKAYVDLLTYLESRYKNIKFPEWRGIKNQKQTE